MLSCWRHLRDSPSCVFLCLTLRPTAEKAGMFLRKPAMREIKWGQAGCDGEAHRVYVWGPGSV